MFKPFEHSGYWWDARDPQTRWPGTLTFDPLNGAVLKRTLQHDLRRLFAKHASFDLIHGEAGNGLAITLINCFERNASSIFANEVITGFHAPEKDPLIATAAAVIENMDEWWAPAAIDHDRERKPPNIGLSYEQPAPVEIHDDGVICTTIRSGARASFERRSVSIDEEIRIELTATTPQKLSVFRQRVHACQDLIAVAGLTLCNLDDFRISPPGPDGPPKTIGHVYGVPIFKNPAEGWPDFLFRSRDIDGRLKDVFTSWLGNAEALSVVRSLYMSGAYGKGFIELRFLALAQAAEAYHRRAHEGRDLYMDPRAYERDILPKLEAAIPAELDRGHRDALRSRLKFGNEVSFARRLKELFAAHEAALAAVIPEPATWIKPIKDYRNGFTHHPAIDDRQGLDKDHLLRCSYVLRILLELCFLRSAGLDAATIATLAGRCEPYRQLRERFFGGGAAQSP